MLAFLMSASELLSAIDFGLLSAAALCVLALLMAWNGGRDMQASALLGGSLVAGLVSLALLQFVIEEAILSRLMVIHAIALVMISCGIALLGICSLVNAWALLTRRQLHGVRGVSALLVFGTGPVVMWFGGWAMVIVVLALIGF